MLISKMSVSSYFFALVIIFTGYIFPVKGYAVPAAPVMHTLTHSDGTIISARQWGDENYHGWETEDGYTIVFDKGLKNWVYAIHNENGKLISSARVVGKDYIPDNCILHMRPVGNERLKIIKQMTTKEQSKSPQLVVPPTGTANIPFIMINFSDTTTSFIPTDFNTLLFGENTYSMKDYYEEVSYGQFSISSGPTGVLGWYTASKNHDYYGENNSMGKDKWPGDLVYEAVLAADPYIDFSIYDMDNNGYVDVVSIIHQGTSEEASGNTMDIWSHRWSLYGAWYYGRSHYGVYTTNDRNANGSYVKVNDYVMQPELLDEETQTTIGVFTHEYGHALGLPDLYDTDQSSEGIGYWSLMAAGGWNYVYTPGDRPAHMDAWSKYFLGWVTPTTVTGTLTNEPITQAATSADVYQLLDGDSLSGEYFLVENRQLSGFDAGLPGTGLLIWYIDGDTISDKIYTKTVNNNECYQPNNCSESHYGVALMQADNNWDLEKNINRGDSTDPYSEDVGKTSFTNTSSPNSKLYSGSNSGVSVTGISASASDMTATLAVGDFSTPTPTPTPTGYIFGQVRDAASTSFKIYHALIVLSTTDSAQLDYTYTDYYGDYNFSNVDTGTYIVSATKDGYEQDSQQVTVIDEQSTRADFYLQPEATPTPTPTATPKPGLPIDDLSLQLEVTPVTCDTATVIIATPTSLTVTKGDEDTVTVTITSANNRGLVGDTVKASVNDSSIATVSPSQAKTDANGQATFTITGNKKGSAKVTFKETSANLKTKTTVNVTK